MTHSYNMSWSLTGNYFNHAHPDLEQSNEIKANLKQIDKVLYNNISADKQQNRTKKACH